MKILGLDIGITSVGWAVINYHKKDLEKSEILQAGVRIFQQTVNPKNQSTLASARREARSNRRNTDRKAGRMYAIKKLLIDEGLISVKRKFTRHGQQEMLNHVFRPKKQARHDVWHLRNEGLTRKFSGEEWFRVLVHIAKHRGYKSNSVDDAENDSGLILKAIKHNKELMANENYLTVGQMVYKESLLHRHKDKKGNEVFGVRRNKKKNYIYSVARDMNESEVEYLFAKQKSMGNPYAVDEIREKYIAIAFNQRPLKSVEHMVGKCTLEKDEPRAPRYSYSAEEFVTVSKIINIKVRGLQDKRKDSSIRLIDLISQKDDIETTEAVIKIFALFKNQLTVSYATLRKKLAIPDGWLFPDIDYNADPEYKTKITASFDKFRDQEDRLTDKQLNKVFADYGYEKEKNKKLKRVSYFYLRKNLDLPDEFQFNKVKYGENPENIALPGLKGYHDLRRALGKKLFAGLSNKQRDKIAEIFTNYKDLTEIEDKLTNSGLAPEIIAALLEGKLRFSTHISFSLKAVNNITSLLYQGKRCDEAVRELYPAQAQETVKQKFLRPLTPEEARQITNPQLKRAFSQTRKVINALIRKFGSMDAIHIELARDLKKSKRQRAEIANRQEENLLEKEAAAKQFVEAFGREPNSGTELLKLRLYYRQHGKSVYSVDPHRLNEKKIDLYRLNEKGYVEIDHILPYSRSFDDSMSNKVLCFAHENQDKGNRTPFEWLANKDPDSQDWQDFIAYAGCCATDKFKLNKLLNKDLPRRWGSDILPEDIEDMGDKTGFLARNIIDTAYQSRFIKNFIEKNLEFAQNENLKQKVKARNGALTDQLRYSWGLPSPKDRESNLHHAEDAVILAFATQSEVQKLSKINAYREYKLFEEIKKELKKPENEGKNGQDIRKELREAKGKFKPPLENMREKVRQSLAVHEQNGGKNIIVSFAPNHKVSGAAHKETIRSKQDIKAKNWTFKFNQGLVEKGEMKRVDVFITPKGKYKLVPLYSFNFLPGMELPDIDIKGKEITADDEFLFSLFKRDLVELTFGSNDYKEPVLAYISHIESDGRFVFQLPEESASRPHKTPIRIRKFNVDVLGNIREIKKEKRREIQTLTNKQKYQKRKKRK